MLFTLLLVTLEILKVERVQQEIFRALLAGKKRALPLSDNKCMPECDLSFGAKTCLSCHTSKSTSKGQYEFCDVETLGAILPRVMTIEK